MSRLFSAAIFCASFCFLSVNHVIAQPDAHSQDYCDKLLPIVSEKLQNDANQQCQSRDTCLACLDRQSGQLVYMTLVIHPNDPKCKPLTTLPDALSRGGQADNPSSFLVEILQGSCGKNGNNLTAFIPGFGSDSSEFSFQWTIDGKDAGTSNKVSCICGKIASLKVHRKTTAEDASVSVKLNPCN